MTRRGRVLVLGDNNAALAVVRSLGRQGLEVVLGIQDPAGMAAVSRYVSAIACFPDATRPINEWYEAFQSLVRNESFDLVIPVTDTSLVPLIRRRHEFDKLAKLAIPSDHGFEYTYSKDKTYQMARALGVPVPETQCVSSSAEFHRLMAEERWKFPLVVKPVASKVWRGDLKVEVPVRVVNDLATLRDAVCRGLSVCPMLLQEFHPGIGIGQEFLAADGEILEAFQHERVHEPLGGGGSTYRRSTAIDSTLLQHSAKILRFLNWTGVVMVEYKRNAANGDAVLVEVNGRFWGSLPLALAAGIDFPADLYRLLVDNKMPIQRPYRGDVYCRKLTDDLYWFFDNWRANHSDRHLLTVPRLHSVAQWFNVLRGREHWDSFSIDDPAPALKEIARLFRTAANSIKSKLSRRYLNWSMKRHWGRRLQQRRLAAAVKRKPELLFVCFGNICRSAFAEAYVARQLRDRAIDGIVSSAGTYKRSNRSSPETACLVSQDFGVSLEQHRSRALDDKLVQSAGAVLCMDLENYQNVRCAYPRARSKTFLLGVLLNDSKPVAIEDPWSKSAEHFRRCFTDIAEAIDTLLAAFPARTGNEAAHLSPNKHGSQNDNSPQVPLCQL